MKSNKGFTLVELLAVIVILAIIALIATPSILNVVDKARKGSAESSALGYIDAIEKQVMINEVEGTNRFDLSAAKKYTGANLKTFNVAVKGDEPDGTKTSVVIGTKGEVEEAVIFVNDFYVYYKDGEIDKTKTDKTTVPTLTSEAPAYSAS